MPAKNAVSMRIHFSRVDVAPTASDERNDCLYYNPSGQESADTCGNAAHILRASYPTGFWTRFAPVPFHLHLETDASGVAWGFNVDRIEYFTGIPAQPDVPWAFPLSTTSIQIGHSPASGAEKTNLYRATNSAGPYTRDRDAYRDQRQRPRLRRLGKNDRHDLLLQGLQHQRPR
ncbi:MAG: hypothetical protein QM756_33315 [Polyangiaceae bacterium]